MITRDDQSLVWLNCGKPAKSRKSGCGEIQNRLTVKHGVIRSDIWPLVEFPVRS